MSDGSIAVGRGPRRAPLAGVAGPPKATDGDGRIVPPLPALAECTGDATPPPPRAALAGTPP